ncbi:hypothetical protein R6Z07F_013833 [Ovis aries]
MPEPRSEILISPLGATRSPGRFRAAPGVSTRDPSTPFPVRMSQKSDRGQGLLSIVLASHQLLPDAVSLATTQAHSLQTPVTTATGVLGRTESQVRQDYTSQQPPRAGVPDGSVGQESACSAGDSQSRVRSLGREDPLEEGTAACSSVLAWRILRTEEAAGCGPWIRKESDTTEGVSIFPQSIFFLKRVD